MIRTLVVFATCCLLSHSATADNWAQWRGPALNGVAVGTGFPIKWSQTENVQWKVPMPGRGASTPIVWEDRIFLTCGIEGKNTVLCYDRAGKELWRTAAGDERAGKHKKGSGSNPSTSTDGKHVFAYFKSGDLTCLDYEGKVVWHHQLSYDPESLWWDLGSSPVLTRDYVVVAVMVTGPSYVVAFDKATGKQAWKEAREVPAPVEAAQSYSTPAVVTAADGKETIYVLGADYVTAHDAKDGKELWRVGSLNPDQDGYFRSICSPVVSDGIVIAPYARGKTITAIRTGGSGDVTKSHVLWTKDGLGADVPTPIALDGKVYVCTDGGELACLDIQTGKELWRYEVEKNRNKFTPSPILADGKLYLTREDGTTFVVVPGDKLNVLATNEVNEFTVATPVFVDHQILLRTYEHLYCIGK